MSFAAKQLDMIVGVDVHMVQPPGPVPPVPVPHPYVGMVSDASDQSAATVLINGMPRANAGQMGVAQPPHIPMGGSFVIPVFSESEIQMGSSTVVANGEALSSNGQPVISCQDAGGAPAPVRSWKGAPSKSPMMAPMCSLISIPGGPPVMVGGAPTIIMPGTSQAPKSELATILAKAETSKANPNEDGWLDIEKKDKRGNPIANVWFEATLPNGEKRVGKLNAYGKARLHGLDPGDCKIRFLNGPDWLDLEVVDGMGAPVPNATFEVYVGDQKVAHGTTDARGYALVRDVPPGLGRVVVTSLQTPE